MNIEEFKSNFLYEIDARSSSGAILYASIRRMLNAYHLNGNITENDIISEAYIRGVKAINNGKTIVNLSAWTQLTARYIIAEKSRARRREVALVNDNLVPSSNDENYAELPFELTSTVLEAWQKLSPKDRKLLELKVIQQMSWTKIQQVIENEGGGDFKLTTLRQKKARALRNLRKIYHKLSESKSQDEPGKSKILHAVENQDQEIVAA